MSRKKKNRTKTSAPVFFATDTRGHHIPIPIREVRPNYFLVDMATGDGKRERKCFRDLDHAKTYATQKHTERVNYGMSVFNLTDAQRLDALAAMKILDDRATLAAAATLWARMNPANGSETIVTTAARYVRGMKKEGCRRISLKDKLWKFRKFIRYFGPEQLTAGLSNDDIARFCVDNKYAGTTRRNYERAFNNLLNFYAGNKRGKVRKDEKMPTTWPPATVETVFRTAERFYPAALPGLAVMFFCGLRPHEATRLDWKAIDLAGMDINIAPEISKVRAVRHVAIPENAALWLAAARKQTGLVSGGQHVFRRLRQEIMKKAEISEWPPDVSRHTFATAHYVYHGDDAKTCAQLGHFGSSQTFVRHYKGLMTQREAAKFWKIAPAGGGKVIAMKSLSA